MQEIENVIFKGKEITAKELTVKQVRTVFSKIDKTEPQFLDDLLNEPIPAMIITESTGVSIEEMEDSKPSELMPLIEGVKTVNPFLASMIQRRVEAYDNLKKAGVLHLANQSQSTVAAS